MRNEEIQAILDLATEIGSKNVLSLDSIHQWLVEHLNDYEDELKRFPESAQQPHFDLIMADYDLIQEAMFVVALFDRNDVSFLAARGQPFAVRQFAENDFPEDVLNVLFEIKKRFKTFAEPLIVSRQELDTWLSRKTHSKDDSKMR